MAGPPAASPPGAPAAGARRRRTFVEQLHSRGVFWRIRGGLPGGGAGGAPPGGPPPLGQETRGSVALTIRMI